MTAPTLREALLREILPEGWTLELLREAIRQIDYRYPQNARALQHIFDRLDALPEKVERAITAKLPPLTPETMHLSLSKRRLRAGLCALTGSASEEASDGG